MTADYKAITLIETTSPETVGKTFTTGQKGELKKHTVANVFEGTATTIHVPDAPTMAKVLEVVTASNKLVIVNGIFRGAGDDEIKIRTASRFRELVEADGGNFDAVMKKGEVYTLTKGPKKGKKYAARLQALMEPSGWLLIDADEPVGFPDAWRPLTFQQRLALLEPVAPGLSTAERVELRGSSARVIKAGAQAGEPSHGWVAVDNPEELARAAVALQLHATNAGISFRSPRYSRRTCEEIGGQERTSIDLATWHRGRLNFDSQPTVKAKGYVLADAGIRVVNKGGGVFKASAVAPVTPKARSVFKEKTGLDLHLSGKGSNVLQVVGGQLTMETPIEVRGVEKTLAEWAEHMFEHSLDKIRCEAPFRASDSEAAFISLDREGQPFVYDIGTSTKYTLPGPGPLDDFEVIDEALLMQWAAEPDDETADTDLEAVEPEPDDTTEEPPIVAAAAGEADDETDAEPVVDVDLGAAEGESAAEDVPPAAEPAVGDDDTPVTVEDVKTAALDTPEGVAIVDRYRLQEFKRLNQEIGYLVVEGKGVIVRIAPDATGVLGAQFVSVDAERLFQSNRSVPYVAGSKEPVLKWARLFPVWMDWPGRRSYRGVTFDPKPNVRAVRRLPKAHRSGLRPFDLFLGMAWDAAPGDCKPILAHLREVICGGQAESTTYVLNWLARLVQQPHRPAETALVVRGGQGIGKNTLFDIITDYFGAHGIELTKEQDLVGFNDHLATSVFVSLNEAVWGGNRANEGIIKSLITDPVVYVERKYLPKFRVPNRVHLVILSNNDWAVPVGHDDRRYVVLNPSGHRVGDVAYFSALRACINNGGREAFIKYLLDRDISNFNPRVLPKVVGSIKLEQKMRTANSVVTWLHTLLDDGGLEVEEESAISTGRRRVFVNIDQQPVTKAALYAAYSARARASHLEPPAQFGLKLREVLGEALVTNRKLRNGFRPAQSGPQSQVPCYEFGALVDLRAAFSAYIGESVQWSV